jgi:signal transduction histidine kinase
MKHARYVWLAFACCFAVVLAAMGWISLTACQLEQAESVAREQEAVARRLEAEALRKEAETRRQAAVEENVRLALWRIDTTLAPLIAHESARPYFAYRSFLTPDRADARMFNNDRNRNETLIPSPLLANVPANILLYFQFEPDGRLTSPQVPVGGNRKLAVPEHADQDAVKQAESELLALGRLVDRDKLLTLLPDHRPGPVQVVLSPLEQNKEQRLAQQVQRQNDLQQYGRGGVEYQQRIQAVRSSTVNAVAQQGQPQSQQADYGNASQPTVSGGQFPNNPLLDNNNGLLANSAPNTMGGNFGINSSILPNNYASINGWLLTETDIGGVLMSPLWLDGRLILARRISVAGQEYIQGCVLDWPTIKDSLLTTIADLLPQANLEPAEVAPEEELRPRMLAALPVRLVPGAVPSDAQEWPAVPAIVELFAPSDAFGLGADRSLSPILVSLATAWVGVFLAAAAVAGLLAGVFRLSERRASFVSAVTHELRTPLTTFQMYAEMLAEGMVPDEQQQRQYLRTLRSESLRLTHLVENVLSYARLERGRVGGRIETLSLDELLAPVVARLAARAEQAGMELLVEADNGAGEVLVRANPSAVEQVLFNLVDNAGKYAATAGDMRLHLSLQPNGKTAELRFRDHGPGVSAAARRRLFHSFSKSAHEAAHTAPGVGLGLALSRRLARDMGGDLRLDTRVVDGACFILSLPLA